MVQHTDDMVELIEAQARSRPAALKYPAEDYAVRHGCRKMMPTLLATRFLRSMPPTRLRRLQLIEPKQR